MFLLAFIISFFIVVCLIPPLQKLAYKIEFVDKPKLELYL